MNEKQYNELAIQGAAVARPLAPIGGKALKTHYEITAYPPLKDENGNILHETIVDHETGESYDIVLPDLDNPKWVEEFDNLVTNEGLNDSLDKHFKGSGYTAAWYVGLTDGTPTPAAGDTMASHAGWAEVTAYDEANRQALTLGTVASQSVDNSASKATYTISTNSTTIGGAFLTTNNTKGGSTGILYGVGAFTAGDKVLDDGDTLTVTVTLTAAAA